jgi:hypothetical protein
MLKTDHTHTLTHTFVIFITYCFFMAKMVMQMHLKVMLYTHRLSCYNKYHYITWHLQNNLSEILDNFV